MNYIFLFILRIFWLILHLSISNQPDAIILTSYNFSYVNLKFSALTKNLKYIRSITQFSKLLATNSKWKFGKSLITYMIKGFTFSSFKRWRWWMMNSFIHYLCNLIRKSINIKLRKKLFLLRSNFLKCLNILMPFLSMKQSV